MNDADNGIMSLPLTPPLQPMLASPVANIPTTEGMLFEPKWDGFRCVVFADGHDVTLQSRSGKPLNRYFPEIVDLFRALSQPMVLDGELVVVRDGRLDFDALAERVHPAASRVRLLAVESPAEYVAFDLLALGDRDLLKESTQARRDLLESVLTSGQQLHVTPVTTDHHTAQKWFTLFEGAGLDGVIGKPADSPYTPGKRTMVKIKHKRTADCVVAGLRWHANTTPGEAVGSLLLGLYDDHGILHHVGVAGAFPAKQRHELANELAPLMDNGEQEHPWLIPEAATDGRRIPGGINRWRSEEQAWVPLRPERVVEVGYEHTEGGHPARFRHTAQFARWRPDREPESCRYDQLDEPASYDLAAVLRGEVRAAQS